MVSGAAPLPRGNHPGAGYLIVKPDYFQAMKIPVLQGRAFTRADTKDSPLVVMINEAFARKHFPDRNPIGQQVMIDRGEGKAPPCEVVGVVGNSRHGRRASPLRAGGDGEPDRPGGPEPGGFVRPGGTAATRGEPESRRPSPRGRG